MAILAYGAVNPDLVHQVRRIPRPGDDVRSHAWHLTWGGKVANAAVALAGWGVDVRLSGLVTGEDALGAVLRSELATPGLDLRYLESDPGESTRHCVVMVDRKGDRTMVCTGYEAARWTSVDETMWDGVTAVLLDGFSGGAGVEVAEEAGRREVPVVWIDPEPVDAGLARFVLWSADERSDAEFTASAATVTVLTAGDGPVRVRTADREIAVAPPVIEVVDATGSGDVFAAGCVWGIINGWGLERTVAWAAAAGAALAARGRRAGMPTIAEVEKCLGRNPGRC